MTFLFQKDTSLEIDIEEAKCAAYHFDRRFFTESLLPDLWNIVNDYFQPFYCDINVPLNPPHGGFFTESLLPDLWNIVNDYFQPKDDVVDFIIKNLYQSMIVFVDINKNVTVWDDIDKFLQDFIPISKQSDQSSLAWYEEMRWHVMFTNGHPTIKIPIRLIKIGKIVTMVFGGVPIIFVDAELPFIISTKRLPEQFCPSHKSSMPIQVNNPTFEPSLSTITSLHVYPCGLMTIQKFAYHNNRYIRVPPFTVSWFAN